jgi:peptide-methionine (R)-S-oxide reductase
MIPAARLVLLYAIVVPLSLGFFPTRPPSRQTRPPSRQTSPSSSPRWTRLTDEEWRDRLTPDQFYVLREQGTERPHSSPLNEIKEAGTFVCAGCGSPLFVTSTKYESGTGWPSFYSPVYQDAVTLSTDFKLIVPRTEVSCTTCSGHLGHVFDDGPQPTGQRYCMNGSAMKFQSDAEHPELASQIQERSIATPYRLSASQVLPSVLINGVMGGLFFQSFVARLETTGMTSPLDVFPLIPAVYFGVQAVQACNRLKLT